jgi:hypothetical protein
VTELVTPGVFSAAEKEEDAQGLQICVPRLAAAGAGVQLDIIADRAASPITFVSALADPSKSGIVEQCRDLYARLGVKLAEAGASFDSVVKTAEFIVPAALQDYRGTAEVRREVFSVPYPAATGVVCERLAHPGALIAVEATALTGAR